MYSSIRETSCAASSLRLATLQASSSGRLTTNTRPLTAALLRCFFSMRRKAANSLADGSSRR
ncbi:hypothetical protein D3C87_1744040 [compost metagenome]